MIGGPNPDGRYLLAMIRGDRTYRVTGTRGSTAYLGFQVLAGTGMTPRRMAAYVSDTDLTCDSGSFALVLAAAEPPPEILGDGAVGAHPDGRVVDRGARVHRRPGRRTARIDGHRVPRQRAAAADFRCRGGRAFTAMAWTIVKLATLHRTVKPELLTSPTPW